MFWILALRALYKLSATKLKGDTDAQEKIELAKYANYSINSFCQTGVIILIKYSVTYDCMELLKALQG